MIVWKAVGRLSAIAVGMAFVLALFVWPVLLWGWNGWTGFYVGIMLGRFVLFELQDPVVPLRRTEDAEAEPPSRAVPDDVR